MCLYDNKAILKTTIKEFEKYVNMGQKTYKIYKIGLNQKIPHNWNVLLIKSHEKYFVFALNNQTNNDFIHEYELIHKNEFIEQLSDFEDINYKIYYKKQDQELVGFLLDFFIYYVDMPDKIIMVKE